MVRNKFVSAVITWMDLAEVLGQTTQPGFLKAELLLDHTEWMLNLGSDVSFASLNQILQLPFWCIGSARRLPGRISTLNSAFAPSISGL